MHTHTHTRTHMYIYGNYYIYIFIHIVSPYIYPSGADGRPKFHWGVQVRWDYMRICCGLFEGLCRVGLGFIQDIQACFRVCFGYLWCILGLV